MQDQVSEQNAKPSRRSSPEIAVRNWAIVLLFAFGGGGALLASLVVASLWSIWYAPLVLIYVVLAAKMSVGFLREANALKLQSVRPSRRGISEIVVVASVLASAGALGVLVAGGARGPSVVVPMVALVFAHLLVACSGAEILDDLDRTGPRKEVLAIALKQLRVGGPSPRYAGEPLGCVVLLVMAILFLGFWIVAWFIVEVVAPTVVIVASAMLRPYVKVMGTGPPTFGRYRTMLRLLVGLPLALVPTAMCGFILGNVWRVVVGSG